jgi:2-polyprenyl-6-methoxyphenol hydroxylase-like FAD-dependent oxidoreductase
MGDHFDVVIAGARCAGSPLAIQLARSGLKVAVVDRARFPSDTPSTHFFQAEGIASLKRLGVLDLLVATGAPFIDLATMRVEDIVAEIPWPTRAGDAAGAMSVRRPVLDTILVEAARAAGAEVRTSTKVTGLLTNDGRVTGVGVRSDGRDAELRAQVVVGADGRGSTVGDLVGARPYNVTRSERFFYWSYYEGTCPQRPATAWFHRWDEELMIGFPCDDGAFLVGVGPPLDRLDSFTADAQRSFDAHLAMCEPLAALVTAPGVRRLGRLHRMTNVDGYLRESAGPGWALVGDAGHFKDPTPAQGISDALRQVDRLAPAIVDGLGGREPLDDALARWWRWRDDDAADHYWFAADLGRAGRIPAFFVEALRDLITTAEGTRRFMDVLNHRTRPSEVVTPGAIGGAVWRLMKAGDHPRRQALAEVGRAVSDDYRRRRLNRHPVFAGTSDLVDHYPEVDLATIGDSTLA